MFALVLGQISNNLALKIQHGIDSPGCLTLTSQVPEMSFQASVINSILYLYANNGEVPI